MANIKEQAQSELTNAMRARDERRMLTLRMLIAAIKNAEIAARRELDDAGLQAVALQQAKMRREAAAEFEKAGRMDLVQKERAELVILAAYTFNNVRLMLLSDIGDPYDPEANRGVVGRNYSYQSAGRVTCFFEEKVFNPFMGGGARATAIDEFNGDNFDHSGLDFFGGAYLSVASGGAMPFLVIWNSCSSA